MTRSGLRERDGELDQLATMISAASRGQGRAILITGDAGIGKTALVGEAVRLATDAGMAVFTARGGEFESEFPWGLARQLFEAIVARSTGETSLGPLRGGASLAAPALGGEVCPTAMDATYATLHGLYWLVVNLTRDHPILLVLDDAHWGDVPSLRFVAHLLPRIQELPVLLVAAARPPSAEPGPAADVLARMAIDPVVATLRPAVLTEAASTALVRETLSTDASDDFGRACHEVSGGNPFLLRALIADLADEQVTANRAGVARVRRMTPAAVSASVLLRLARLPRATLDLARAVAVLGTDAELRQAASLAQLDVDEAAGLAGGMMRAGMLVGEQTLAFVHPLVRSAIHGDLAGPERSRWHYRAARMLAVEHEPLERVASQLIESLPNADAWTVECLRAAAADATSRNAPEIAVDCLRRALAEPPSESERVYVLFELGGVVARQDPVAAIPYFEQALAATNDAALRAPIALALGEALTMSARLGEAVDVLRHGIDAGGRDTPELRASLLAALVSAARWDLGSQTVRAQVVGQLTRMAEAGEALHPLLHSQLAIEETALGAHREVAIDHARAALEADSVVSTGAALFPEAALVLVFAGCADEARWRVEDWLARAQQRAWPLGVVMGSTCASLAALYRGDVGEAVAYARGAAAGNADIRLAPVTVAFLIEALIERGALDVAAGELAERGFDGDLPMAWATTPLLLARGRLRAAAGDHRGAVDDLLAVGARCETWEVMNPAMVPWRSSAAVSLARLGQRDRAVALAEEAVGLARRWGAPRCIGVALRAAGVVCDDNNGLEQLRAAVSTLEGSPARLEHARALTDLGAALRRAGQRVEARRQLSEGLDLAHRLGGTAVEQQARAELIIAGARPRRAAVRGRDALTASELRIAQLAGEGRTNREIAETLFLTIRTVETHLTSTYGKLGITSRRQLAVTLHPPDA